MRFSEGVLAFSVVFMALTSCGEDKSVPQIDSIHPHMTDVNGDSVATPTFRGAQNVEAKTFEVIDSLGKKQGWGYDLFIDGKRTIHQPIIPAVSGNNSFATESDAQKVGDLAAQKMKNTGLLPTIMVHDLDSLGIKHLK